MRTTIDLPDPLYREAKAAAALGGFKLRELIAEALRRHLRNPGSQGEAGAGTGGVVPRVRAEELGRYPDFESLRRAFPEGYRLVGPLVPSGGSARRLTALRVAEAEAEMDAEETDRYGRPG